MYSMTYYVKKPYAVSRRYTKPEESQQLLACRYLKKFYSDVDFMSDFSAGMYMTINQAKKRKAMNSGRGMTDLIVLKPSRGYKALLIDFKREGTSIYVTKGPRKGELVADSHIREQAAFMEKMNKLGYLARFCIGYEQFTKLITWYMETPTDESVF
jgi:hypothetical protein